MTFDWFTFVAQIINFLILLYFLRRFLYGPISRIMKERQARIVGQIEAAQVREEEAQAALARYREEQETLENMREHLTAEARREADGVRQNLIKEARAEVDFQRRQWQETLARDKEAFLNALQKRMSSELYESMRSALADLADIELEQQIVQVFVNQLHELPDVSKEQMRAALRQAHNQVQFVSAFALPKASREALLQTLTDLFGQGLKIEYEVKADLICGLELSIFDQKVSWSLATYLATLQTAVATYFPGNRFGVQEAGAL